MFIYDKSIYLNSNYNKEEVNTLLDSNKDIIDKVNINYKQINLYNSNKDYFEVNLITPEDSNTLDKVIHLNDDYIVENYIDDYAYITEDTYKEIYNDYDVNSIYLNVNDNYNEDYDKELLSNSNIVNIINKKDTSNVMEGVLDKLNYVVLILIISSALLAFAILYNLSSINIERKREISTLKVLGFYNDEVDRYITNENYFITVVGIILGLILGFYLCFYLLNTCEPDYLMFIRHIKWYSYLISAVISCLFTIIVSRITHYNLLKIDMISSLKSNE